MLTMEELGYFIYMDSIENQQTTDQSESDEADETLKKSQSLEQTIKDH